MPVHVVRQGESLAKIARRHGRDDWRAIYEHADNAALRSKRPNPNVLHPGDEVVIPDLELKSVDVETDQLHTFELAAAESAMFRMKLLDDQGEALAEVAYQLHVDGEQVADATTDDAGMIEVEIDHGAVRGELRVLGRTIALCFDELDPISRITGVQARLVNLGYAPGKIDGDLGPKTRAAVRAFQAKHDLEPTGRVDDDTRKALLAAHDFDDRLLDAEDDFEADDDGDTDDPDGAPPPSRFDVDDHALLAAAPTEPWTRDDDGYELGG